MKNKGFTLIELLAVIVILAIIALIATSIILNIISDSKEESNKRSVELYGKAVEQAITKSQLNGSEIAAGDLSSSLLSTVEYSGNEVTCTTNKLYEDGGIYLAGCTVGSDTKEYSYGIEEETPVAKVCSIEKQDASKYSKGDVVTCNIGETPDKFYVIEDGELSATTIQMLTEKNIHTTEYRQSDSARPIAFSSTNYWSADSYPADVYNNDSLLYPIVEEYVSYLNTKLTNATGSLLTYSQAENLGCNNSSKSCSSAPSWVYSTTYWTGSASGSNVVWIVYSNGLFAGDRYVNGGTYGVRPVITISKSSIN